MMKYLTILLCFFLSLEIALANGRSPAVEPVTGISIDDQPESTPKKATPFNFGQPYEQKRLRNNNDFLNPGNDQINGIQDTSSLGEKIVLVLILSLPFALWAFLMKQMPDAAPGETKPQIYVVKGKQEESEASEDEDDIKKAS